MIHGSHIRIEYVKTMDIISRHMRKSYIYNFYVRTAYEMYENISSNLGKIILSPV